MKKSTKTPEPATPDQVLEDGPSQRESVSAGLQQIYAIMHPGNRFLFFRHALDDPFIRITTVEGPFFLWRLVYSDLKKAYQIRSASADRVITAGNLNDEVLADVDNGDDRRFWRISDAGDDSVYIESLAFSGKVLTLDGLRDNSLVLCSERTGSNYQKFRVEL